MGVSGTWEILYVMEDTFHLFFSFQKPDALLGRKIVFT